MKLERIGEWVRSNNRCGECVEAYFLITDIEIWHEPEFELGWCVLLIGRRSSHKRRFKYQSEAAAFAREIMNGGKE